MQFSSIIIFKFFYISIYLLLDFEQIHSFIHTSCKKNVSVENRIYFSVLLPEDTFYLSSYQKVAPAIELGFREVKKRGLLPGLEIETSYGNTKCDPQFGTWEAMKAFFQTPIHVFLGPSCDYVAAGVARLLKFFKLPMITGGALAYDFNQVGRRNNDSEYYMLVRTGWSFKGMANTLDQLFKRFNWHSVLFLYEENGRPEIMKDHYCSTSLLAVHEEVTAKGNFTMHQYRMKDNLTPDVAKNILKTKAGNDFGVIVLCASPDAVREILLAAEELGMISSGEYVFFSIELFTSKMESEQPWKRESDTDDRNNRARNAYEALLTVTARIPETEEYMNFSREVKEIARQEFSFEYGKEEVNAFVVAFHEAVLLYSLALNETLEEGYNASDGSIIIQKMWNRTFEGISGKVTMDENGDRVADYSILDLNPESEKFEVVANYIGTEKRVVDEPGKKFHWAGGRTEPPPDNTKRGFVVSKCPQYGDKQRLITIVLSVVVVFVFL